MPPPSDPAPAGTGTASLSHLAVLEGLPAPVAELVSAAFIPLEFGFGDEIIRQGDEPDGFYVVVSGRVRAVRDQPEGEVALGSLGPGESFGEAGLLDGAPRAATVRASGPVKVLRLEPALFKAIATRHPEVQARLKAQARARRIQPLLNQHPVFSVLDQAALLDLAGRVEEVEIRAGQAVFHQGDPPGPMYLVWRGRLRARESTLGDINYMRAGDVFGEMSVHTGRPRAATVEAVTDASLLVFGQELFSDLEARNPRLRERVDEQVALYRAGPARAIPLDFAGELLPAVAEPAAMVAEPTAVMTGTLATMAGNGPAAPAGLAPDGTTAPDEAVTPSPPGTRRQAGRPWGRRARHVHHIRQLDEADCGAACVAMLCRHFGHPVRMSVIRQAVGTSVDGTSLRGIQQGGEAVGLEVKPAKFSRDRLGSLTLPAIVHWRGDHWMVLDEVRADRVHVADPATANRWMARQDFLDGWTGYAARVSATAKLAGAPGESANLGWLAPVVRPYAPKLALVIVLALGAAALQMLVPVVTGMIVDTVIPHRDFAELYWLCGSLVVLQITALLAAMAKARVLTRAAVRIDAATLDYVAARLLRLPLSYFESRRTGDIESRLDSMREVRELALQQGSAALTYAAQLLMAVVLMLLTSVPLGLAWLVTIPVYIALARVWAGRIRPAYAELQEGFGRYRARRIDSIKGIETVKALGREGPLRRSMLREFEDIAARVVKADLTAISYGGTTMFATFTFLLVFLLIGSLEVMHHHLSVGGLVAFNSLALLASGPVLGLLDLWDIWQQGAVQLSRLQDVLDHEPEQSDGGTPLRDVPTLEGRVTVRGLTFSYQNSPDVPVLDNISLDVRPGMTVAFVGRSGSGKSTLLKCLAGLLQPSEGVVEMDGVDLRELNLVSLRRRIGTVPQFPYVFDGTVTANIAFAEVAPNMDDVRAAAEIADAHEFIERLPLGYNTKVGEGGIRLSGGQAQRIAIARAIFHRPPVLLLDEATSALDSEAERAVTENLRRLLEGRTAFVVAHRLSTVRDADLIVVLERGRMVESGTHDQLLSRNGLYVHLYGQQLAG